MSKLKRPKPKLKPGVIYMDDGGRLICMECAWPSTKHTGRSLSGRKVQAVPYSETVMWHKDFNVPMRCESGCTTYLLPVP